MDSSRKATKRKGKGLNKKKTENQWDMVDKDMRNITQSGKPNDIQDVC